MESGVTELVSCSGIQQWPWLRREADDARNTELVFTELRLEKLKTPQVNIGMNLGVWTSDSSSVEVRDWTRWCIRGPFSLEIALFWHLAEALGTSDFRMSLMWGGFFNHESSFPSRVYIIWGVCIHWIWSLGMEVLRHCLYNICATWKGHSSYNICPGLCDFGLFSFFFGYI